MENEKTTHPSIGLVRLSRWSGNIGKLVGSDIDHHGGISLTISHAHASRRLSQTNYYEDGIISEVYLTEAQFAQLITRFNQEGTPCTIRHTEKDGIIERMPAQKNELEFHKSEAVVIVDELYSKIQDLKEQVKNMVDSKKTGIKPIKDVLFDLGTLESHFKSNQNFIVKSLQEAMVDTVTEAKIDFEAYVQNHPAIDGVKNVPKLLEE